MGCGSRSDKLNLLKIGFLRGRKHLKGKIRMGKDLWIGMLK